METHNPTIYPPLYKTGVYLEELESSYQTHFINMYYIQFI